MTFCSTPGLSVTHLTKLPSPSFRTTPRDVRPFGSKFGTPPSCSIRSAAIIMCLRSSLACSQKSGANAAVFKPIRRDGHHRLAENTDDFRSQNGLEKIDRCLCVHIGTRLRPAGSRNSLALARSEQTSFRKRFSVLPCSSNIIFSHQSKPGPTSYRSSQTPEIRNNTASAKASRGTACIAQKTHRMSNKIEIEPDDRGAHQRHSATPTCK